MEFAPSEPFTPRPIRSLGLIQRASWQIKLYSITYGDEPLDRATYDEALDRAMNDLPQPAIIAHRPGVGFAICHQGRGWHYLVLNWWDNENELSQRVWVRERDDASAQWRRAASNQSICVWDLQVIWFEREQYVKHVLSGRVNLDAYLAERLT